MSSDESSLGVDVKTPPPQEDQEMKPPEEEPSRPEGAELEAREPWPACKGLNDYG